MRRVKPLEQRLYSKLLIDPSGCVLWTGALGGGGYGYISLPGRKLVRVHRAMWELMNGPIPEGMVIDHLCRVRRCVNVAHLEVVTHRTNTLRGTSPAALEAVQEVCLRGHEFNLINTYWTPDGKRHCRACRKVRRQARKAVAS